MTGLNKHPWYGHLQPSCCSQQHAGLVASLTFSCVTSSYCLRARLSGCSRPATCTAGSKPPGTSVTSSTCSAAQLCQTQFTCGF
jgi:hypothetical protein